ncbi:hypothetical protein [Bradyrhizobium sp. HKCCYLS20291]|uniref:hypothetical protein n=1 Tax=Bradyrhizobium sp. HKCCYLS20291 TaxID=3420766 RepID=UPI003EC13430
MAADLVVCTVYDVGQGACNFFEIYDSTDHTKPAHTMLIDCGTAAKTSACNDAVDKIVKILKTMVSPTIDTLILTHSDKDHISHIVRLIEHFNPPGGNNSDLPTLNINRIYFGGDRNNYSLGRRGKKKNVVNKASKYINKLTREASVKSPGPDQTGYDASKKTWDPFHDIDGVKLYLLAGNTQKSNVTILAEAPKDAAGGYLKNMVSLVVIVEFSGVKIVGTGDGTGLTMARCNQVLSPSPIDSSLDYSLLDEPLKNVFMVTLPHHGSSLTSFELLGLSDDKNSAKKLAKKNVVNFAQNMSTETITASAYKYEHHHPGTKLIQCFSENLKQTAAYYEDPCLAKTGRHFYTVYIPSGTYNATINQQDENAMDIEKLIKWPNSVNYFTVQTPNNIFTTMYFLVDRQNTSSYDWCAVFPAGTGSLSRAPLAKANVENAPPLPQSGMTWKFSIDGKGGKTVSTVPNNFSRLSPLPIQTPAFNAPVKMKPVTSSMRPSAKPRLSSISTFRGLTLVP